MTDQQKQQLYDDIRTAHRASYSPDPTPEQIADRMVTMLTNKFGASVPMDVIHEIIVGLLRL